MTDEFGVLREFIPTVLQYIFYLQNQTISLTYLLFQKLKGHEEVTTAEETTEVSMTLSLVVMKP